MGRGHYDLGELGPRLTFTMKADDKNVSQPIRVKVEIATRERTVYDGAQIIPFEVKNPWFTGKADIVTFSREEILATKLRALLQRDKGRDLVDLAKAVALFSDLDTARVVALFGKYLNRPFRAPKLSSACGPSLLTLRSSPMCARCCPWMKPKSLTARLSALLSSPSSQSS
jgi:hypothetical protein